MAITSRSTVHLTAWITRLLRFRPQPAEAVTGTRRRSIVGSRQRWRLWLLLVALGLVIATIRQLDRPSTVERLGQTFGAPETATLAESEHQFVLGMDGTFEDPVEAAALDKAADPGVPLSARDDANDALAQVQDNTYFRPAENEAWFDLFGRLQKLNDLQLRKLSQGELTYTQLLKQPQVYRGKVVTIQGTLRREEVEHPPENALGIEAYHRLVIQPRGGGHWPFVVYCLKLPSGFPRGDKLQEPIAVNGFFFKNWSYSWQDGLGIAPVILARRVDWQPRAAAPTRNSITSQGLTNAILAACVFAIITVYLVFRNTRQTRRPSPPSSLIAFPNESAVETVPQQLKRLADTEPPE